MIKRTNRACPVLRLPEGTRKAATGCGRKPNHRKAGVRRAVSQSSRMTEGRSNRSGATS